MEGKKSYYAAGKYKSERRYLRTAFAKFIFSSYQLYVSARLKIVRHITSLKSLNH